MTRRRGHGFTLVELLVALFIAAIMFAMGYGAINQALRDRTQLAESQKRLTTVQTAMRLLVQDLSLVAPRPTRNPLSADSDPVLVSEPGNNANLITLVRSSWANPQGAQRPTLQKVRYVLEDRKLIREHWRVVDPLPGSEPVRRTVIDQVKAVRFRFMTAPPQRSWVPDWGATGSRPSTAPDIRNRPIAIEVTLDLEDFGELVRIVEVIG
jgi:general secretion pathway protein J